MTPAELAKLEALVKGWRHGVRYLLDPDDNMTVRIDDDERYGPDGGEFATFEFDGAAEMFVALINAAPELIRMAKKYQDLGLEQLCHIPDPTVRIREAVLLYADDTQAVRHVMKKSGGKCNPGEVMSAIRKLRPCKETTMTTDKPTAENEAPLQKPPTTPPTHPTSPPVDKTTGTTTGRRAVPQDDEEDHDC
jgi:hypothetical protein